MASMPIMSLQKLLVRYLNLFRKFEQLVCSFVQKTLLEGEYAQDKIVPIRRYIPAY
jgi:hypothetical protein